MSIKKFKLDSERLRALISLDHETDGLTKEEIEKRVSLLYDLPSSGVAKALKEGLVKGFLKKKNYNYIVSRRSCAIPTNSLCGTASKSKIKEERRGCRKPATRKERKKDTPKRDPCMGTGKSKRKVKRAKEQNNSGDEKCKVQKDKKKRETQRKVKRTKNQPKSKDEHCKIVKGKRKQSERSKSKETKRVKCSC